MRYTYEQKLQRAQTAVFLVNGLLLEDNYHKHMGNQSYNPEDLESLMLLDILAKKEVHRISSEIRRRSRNA